MPRMRRTLIALALLGLLLTPAVAQAVDWIPIVPCGLNGQEACKPCHIFQTIKNLFDLILYGITGPIAAFMIVWAGGMMLLGGGDPGLYSKGKTMLQNTLIGVTIILLSWVMTNFLIKSLIRGGQGDNWNQFTCPAGLSAIAPIETTLPSGGPAAPALPAPTTLVPKFAGVPTYQDTFDICENNVKCPDPGSCPKFKEPLQKAGGNAKILEAIMLNESSCLINPRPSGAGAYGIMQMKPATAATFRENCDLYEKKPDGSYELDKDGNKIPENIDAAWLQSELNLEKIICAASAFVDTLKAACGSNPLNIAAGYNGGPGACAPSVSCASLPSCVGGAMRRWECTWDNIAHTNPNRGYVETRKYAPKVAACAR